MKAALGRIGKSVGEPNLPSNNTNALHSAQQATANRNARMGLSTSSNANDNSQRLRAAIMEDCQQHKEVDSAYTKVRHIAVTNSPHCGGFSISTQFNEDN